MWARLLQQIRRSVREQTIIVRQHAFEEMMNDDLLQDDIECCLLTGQIAERQWDEDWHEWKYVVVGLSLAEDNIEVVIKLNVQRHAVVITAYRS